MPLPAELEQDIKAELYEARFQKNFNATDLKDKKIIYGVSLFNPNHTGNRLKASLELIAHYTPKLCGWFIACELGYLNVQINNPKLKKEVARAEAREEGDQLATAHTPLLEAMRKTYHMDYTILRWYNFDNEENTEANTIFFKESLVQVYFLYLLGTLSIDCPSLLDFFNKINKNKNDTFINDFIEIFCQSDSQKKLICSFIKKLNRLNVFNKKPFSIQELFSVTFKLDDIVQFAQEFAKTVNTLAKNRTQEQIKEKEEQRSAVNFSSKKPAKTDTIFFTTKNRNYALLDVAEILALAKTKEYDYLLYPLRQQKTYQHFFKLIRFLCKQFGLEIIDILLEKKKLQPIQNMSPAVLLPPSPPSQPSTPAGEEKYASKIASFGFLPIGSGTKEKLNLSTSPLSASPNKLSDPAEEMLQSDLEEIEHDAQILHALADSLRKKAERRTETYTSIFKDPIDDKSREALHKLAAYRSLQLNFGYNSNNQLSPRLAPINS